MITAITMMTMNMSMSVIVEIILQCAQLIVLVCLVANVGMQVSKSVIKYSKEYIIKINPFIVSSLADYLSPVHLVWKLRKNPLD